MIYPLAPYPIQGTIWYQGESNTSRAKQYGFLFPQMIRDWRSLWQDDEMSFFYVELASYLRRVDQAENNSRWAELRQSQREALKLPRTGMATAIDIGAARASHPKNKQDVGKRLALSALAVEYGKKIVHKGPLMTGYSGNADPAKHDTIKLVFMDVADGLKAMKQLLLICWVVALVGCGQPAVTHEEVEKEEAEMRALLNSLETENEEITNPDTPKTPDKKPLTKEESAKVIEAAIREQLDKPTGELTEADLKKVTKLDLSFQQLTDVPKGLEKLTQLTKLYLNSNQLSDVKGLENLTRLTYLNLGYNQLTDVKGLEKLTQLTNLVLCYNQLTDVKGLEKLTQLITLSLPNNKLTGVKGLEKFTQLTGLNLENNQLTDVKGLEKLTQLTSLYLANNPDLTKAQIAELKKAFPIREIYSNPTK